MASFNKITIVGYLGRDPEIRYTPQGTAVCDFSVATTEKRGDNENTTWFKIEAWGKLAELCNQYLAKGRQCYIEGRLRQEEYTSREGEKRTQIIVTANEIHFLGDKPESTGRNDAAMAAQAPAEPRGKAKAAPKSQEDDGWQPPF